MTALDTGDDDVIVEIIIWTIYLAIKGLALLPISVLIALNVLAILWILFNVFR